MTLITQVRFKQKNTFSLITLPDINTRGCGRIRDSYANPRQTQAPFQIRACMISARKAKHFDVTTAFTYSHENAPLGQSERAY